MLKRMTTLLTLAAALAVVAGAPAAQRQPEAGTMVAYLVSEQSGAPLEGADVRLVATLKQQGEIGEGQLRFLMRPQGMGAYSLDGIQPGEYVIQVMAPGHAPALREVHIRAGEGHREVFQLPESGTLRGIVRDEKGKPLPDADLTLSYTDQEMLSLLERMSATGPFASARTDRLGRYEIADFIAAGMPFILEAAHEGFLPVITQEAVVRPGETATLEVRMRERAVKLTGEVFDQDGRPVASAVVALKAKPPTSPLLLADGREVPHRDSLFSLIAPARWACFRPQGMTGADGGFSFPTLPAGEVTVTIRHRGYRTYSETLDLHDEDNHVKVFLTRE